MSLSSNFNTSSILTHNALVMNDQLMSAVMSRLSSGIRISHAKDDPNGLVAANTMRTQYLGLQQASDNGEKGVTLLQTAEGSMDQISSALTTLRTLAVSAANQGLNDPAQLQALQNQFDSAVTGINKTATQSMFGDLNLLQGDFAQTTLGDDARAFYSGVHIDATKLPAGVTDGSAVTVGAPSSDLTHESVSVTLTDGLGNPQPSTATLNGLSKGGVTLTIAAPISITIGGAKGTQTLTIGPKSTIGDLVGLINSGTDKTGVRASYDASTGQLLVASAGFGSGTLSIVAPDDLSGGANISFLDTDTTSPTSNPLLPAHDLYQMSMLTNNVPPTTVAAATDTVQGSVDNGSGAVFDAVDGKSLTIYGRGTSATMPLTASTTFQDVVDWVNGQNATLGTSADFDATTGTLSVVGSTGSIQLAADSMSTATPNSGLLDLDVAHLASTGGTKVASAANATIQLAFTDANGTARSVTLTEEPTADGGRTFVNLLPGPENAAPYSGWQAGALRVTLKDTSGGGFSGSITAPTVPIDVTKTSSHKLLLGTHIDASRTIELRDMRAAALGQSAFQAQLATGDPTQPLVAKGYHSLQDLVDKQALVNGNAQDVIGMIDAAIKEVTNTRGTAGALQAQGVQSTLASLSLQTENLQSAESTIRDTDFAADSSEYARLQVMTQAATAMLAQANQIPTQVLSLLFGSH